MTAPTTALAAAPPPPPAFALVPFHGAEVLAARVGGEVRVPMKRFCGTIGLDWPPQLRRIQRDDVLREGVTMMVIPTEGGDQAQVTLPADLLAGFLFGADASRHPPELRERIRLFRRECFAVLHAHFTRAAAPAPVVARPAPAPVWQELDAARRAGPALIAAISAERRPAVRRYLHALLAGDGDRLGLPVPALADLGHDAPTPIERLTGMLQGLDVLTARGTAWNHLGEGANGRLGLVLPQLRRLFARNDIDVQIDGELRAALLSSAAWRVTRERVTSAITGKPVLATIVAPWPNGELG